jgi:hypothetical protein
MGFALLGLSGESLARGFARTPPARFAETALTSGTHRRPGVSIDFRLAKPATRQAGSEGPATLVGFLHQCAPGVRANGCPGYEFASPRAVHYCRLPRLLEHPTSLDRSRSGSH